MLQRTKRQIGLFEVHCFTMFITALFRFVFSNETGLPKVQYLHTSGKFKIRKGWQEGKLCHGEGTMGPFL